MHNFQLVLLILFILRRVSASCHFQGVIHHFSYIKLWAVPWLRRLAAGLPLRRPGFDPGSVHVGFVMAQSGTGTGFSPEYFSFPLSISFHRCSITRKRTKSNNHHHRHLHHRVAQEASRCVRSVCCGALHHYYIKLF
jgi:hypothetical protein